MNESVKHDCAALLAHAEWVRALARHLVMDAHTADDLAQDALAAALVRPPPGDRPLRSWLAAVLRNLVREARRDAGNRRARERAAAREEVDSSSAELLERLDSHRAVVEAVARLDEPYRAAILMRWFEGLSPAAIAARTGTPLRTVETRLHRALARLRAELDRTHGGDRRAWLLALIPFARGSRGWSAAAIGALVMDAKLKIAVAALVVAGVCSTLVFWKSAGSMASSQLALAPEALEGVQEGAHGPERARAAAPAAGERRAIEAPAPVMAPEPVPVPAPKLSGRVIDVERVPVAGVMVRYSDPEHGPNAGLEAGTGVNGVFELEQPQGGGQLDVTTPGWTCIFRPEFADRPDARELVLVVARSITVGGRVTDGHGQGIEAASVALPLPFGLRTRFDAILYGSSTVEHGTRTGPGGLFELADVPLVQGVELVTTHAAYLTDRRALPACDQLALEIVLRPAHEESRHLVGTVVDPGGNPVEGAWVAFGASSTRSGPAGEFALELDAPGGDAIRREPPGREPLRAVKPGYLPAEVACPLGEAWPEPLILHLGEPPLTITGCVVDAGGEAVPLAEVWTSGETHFGTIAIEGGEMTMRAGASVEGILRGDPWTRRTATDARGRFELHGLLPRDYRVHALEKTHLLATATSLPAGSNGVVLRMPDEELHELVAGRVTSLSGEPLEGLEVVLERATADAPGSELDRLQGRAATTDADGRFRFENVSRAASLIQVSGSELGLMGFERRIGVEEDVEDLEIAVPLRVHVRIHAGEAAGFERAALLDAHGERLTLSVHHGKSSYAMSEIHLEKGQSESFSVSELAVTLILYGGGAEVRRMPVELVRGELNTIRP